MSISMLLTSVAASKTESFRRSSILSFLDATADAKM